MSNGMSKFEGTSKLEQVVPKMRSVGIIEFRGIMKGTIPVCDLFGEYDVSGLAIVQKNGKLGVIDMEPKMVLSIEYEDVEILLDGNILAFKDNEFCLYDKNGRIITRNVSFPEIK